MTQKSHETRAIGQAPTGSSEPRTHDFTHGLWGSHCTVSEILAENRIKCWGHDSHDGMLMARIEVGDYLILPNKGARGPSHVGAETRMGQIEGQTTRYQVETIRYADDPKDMFFLTAAFAPRPGPS